MAYNGLRSFCDRLEREGELIRIGEFADPVLEITEITDRISKLPRGGKALLFENTGTPFPLLINALGSENRMALALGRTRLSEVGEEMTGYFRGLVSSGAGWRERLKMLPMLKEMASWMPKKISGRGACQQVVMDRPDLGLLPVLQCWPADGGRFITLPAVHTRDPETGLPNTGMYRMQIFGSNLAGMHWHPHKTGAAHFAKYKSSGKRMPVTVTLGGDPVYTYAATAPMPENMDEYLLAGFLRKKQVRLVQCLTNDLYVPESADFVIEGFVDPAEEPLWEGPFGDHTGFYSLAGYFPGFHVTCITHRRDAIYPATIVGIPPMEDAWIGKATERIFLSPLRLTMIPELVDLDLPFAGVAHNISIVKIRKSYPGQAVKVMHSLWGAGQMMFNKIMVAVDGFTPLADREWLPEDGGRCDNSYPRKEEAGIDIHDYIWLARIFSRNFDPGYSIHFSKGPLDILDHSSRHCSFGSKLGIDLTTPFPEERLGNAAPTGPPPPEFEAISDVPSVTGARSLFPGYSLPVLLLAVKKDEAFSKSVLEKKLAEAPQMTGFKIAVLFDQGADLSDLFSLVWLLGGNLEPDRDISFLSTSGGGTTILVDATFKTAEHDQFQRQWPNIVTMDDTTIDAIDRKWPALGLGEFIPSPSLKYKSLVGGKGAVRAL